MLDRPDESWVKSSEQGARGGNRSGHASDSCSDHEIVIASALPKPQNPIPAFVAFLSAM